MSTQLNHCFHCMEPIDHREQRCPHCGYDNRTRDNGPSMLCDTLLAGQYLIGRVLGRGGFGVTYLGYDINLQIKVAIKEYYPSHLVARAKDDMTLSALSGNEESYQKGLERALKESRMAAGLRYVPGVVQVHNVLSANNTVYIVMDYVDGDTLTGYVEKHGGMLTLPEALRLLDPVARALTALHGRKVIHRDVKPDNIMIHRETGEGILLDFGAARIADDSTMSRSAAVVSAGYAPPEQYNQSSLDGRIDQYALAATLMYALTGRRPPDVMERLAQSNALPALSKLNPSVSPAAEAAILKGMALKADGRYPAVTDLWAALTAAASGKKAPAKDKFNLTKTIALALSITLAGGVLAYYVPRSPLWQQIFGKPQPVAGSSGVEAPQLPTAIPEPVVDEPTAAPTENPYARLFAYYVQSDDTIFIEQYIGSDPEVVVPATIDGFPVSVIGHEAFRNCGDVTSVTLPDGLTELGTYAFAGCRNLKELAIPKSVHTIGPCAFNECVLLEHLVIPEGVALIEDLTFYNCASLKTVTIPESVITIDQSAFSGETHPTLIVVAGSYGELFAQRNGFAYRSIATKEDFKYSATGDGGICIDKYIGTADKVMIPDTIDGKPVRQIGPSAFYQCAAIREIVLPESINAIGEHAFSGCSLLSSINIPEGVEAISNRTFSDCTSLNAITLPQSLYTIGDHAFSGCSDLGSITLPENLSHIGQFAFSSCSDLTSITLPPWISCLMDGTFSGCTKLASITFPAQDFNMISHQVFADCTSLTELNLPAALEFIGDDAFSGCTGLTSLVIPEGTTTIGNRGFSGCTGLTEVTLPEGITFMGSHAFENCPNLTSINIPASLTMLSFSVFEGCPDLTLTVIPGSYGETFAKEQGIPYVFAGEEASGEPVDDPAPDPAPGFQYQIGPQGTVTIDRYVGSETQVEIPGTIEGYPVTIIGQEAFLNHRQITSITVPDSVTLIKGSAFENCIALTGITLPEGLQNIGSRAFSGCESLTAITLPESLVFIGPSTFAGCTALTGITLPEHVSSIEAAAFEDCKALAGVTFHAQEDSIANRLFSGCEGLTTLTLPEGIGTIGDRSFANCKSLTSLSIPQSVTHITPSAFAGCPDLVLTVVAGSYGETFAKERGIAYVYEGATAAPEATTAEAVTIEDVPVEDVKYTVREDGTVTITKYIGQAQHLRLPAEIEGKPVTRIGAEAFYGCDSQQTVVVPEGVTTIGKAAFFHCDGLTQVILPETLLTINDGLTFSGCPNLMQVNLPASLTSVGDKAFSECPNLSLTVVAGTYGEEYAKRTGIPYEVVQAAASAAPEATTTAAPATDFEYTKLEDGTIELNSYLGKEAKVVIPAQVEGQPVSKLGNYLFYRNHQMTEVVIPDTVTTIAHKAFYQCTSLREITIPDGVTTIGSYAFHNCDSLTTIVFPEGVETIGDWAFSFCDNLTSVTLPASVTSIGGSATDRDSQLVLTVVAGSYGETFAKERGIPYVYEGATAAPEGTTSEAPATDFEYTKLEDGTIELNSYLGKEAKVVIPAQVEGLPVTKLGNYLFYRNHQLTEVVIPDTVTTIAHKAFYQCTSLREITIPDGVTTIGSYAFHSCSSLTSIVFPEGVETIEDWAFSYCPNLTSVTLPASATSIGGITDQDFQLVLTVVAGSYGEEYAKKNNIPYVYAEASRPFLPGAVRYEEMPGGDGAIDACYAGMAADGSLAGYVVQASQHGFGGPIQVTVGVDLSGTITGMKVGGDQFAETIMIGARVQEDFFANAFIGLTATPVAGGNVEAISGATVSSSATIDAAAIAYDYAVSLLAAQ